MPLQSLFFLLFFLDCFKYSDCSAGVVELVDTPDLGSGGESRGGSSPFTRTIEFRLSDFCSFKQLNVEVWIM